MFNVNRLQIVGAHLCTRTYCSLCTSLSTGSEEMGQRGCTNISSLSLDTNLISRTIVYVSFVHVLYPIPYFLQLRSPPPNCKARISFLSLESSRSLPNGLFRQQFPSSKAGMQILHDDESDSFVKKISFKLQSDFFRANETFFYKNN